MTYAANTDVSVEKSKAEIERILRRYGADGFMSGWEGSVAFLRFRVTNPSARIVSLQVEMPDRHDRQFTHYQRVSYGSMIERKESVADGLWEQACRQRWRAMKLIVQAALEAVEIGVMTFDEAFMAFIELPNGQTISQHLAPKLAALTENSPMPVLLLAGKK